MIYIFITYFVVSFLSANYAVAFIYEWNALLLYEYTYVYTHAYVSMSVVHMRSSILYNFARLNCQKNKQDVCLLPSDVSILMI